MRRHRLVEDDVLLPTSFQAAGRLAITGMCCAELAVTVFTLNLTGHELWTSDPWLTPTISSGYHIVSQGSKRTNEYIPNCIRGRNADSSFEHW
jgi:hypothetical protein